MKAIIIDIDGTVAEKCSQRDIYDFSKVEYDYPIWPTIRVVQNLMKQYVPIFVSGRKEVAWKATARWLNHWVGVSLDDNPGTWFLFMRKDNDNRCDTIVKREIYDQNIKDRMEVLCVFDDRKKVINMWRSLGLFVFNCSQLEYNDF